jgi:hypothetical protein
MSTTPQKRALARFRKRLNQRGMARFEVLGLAGDDPDSARLRATVRLTISGESRKRAVS